MIDSKCSFPVLRQRTAFVVTQSLSSSQPHSEALVKGSCINSCSKALVNTDVFLNWVLWVTRDHASCTKWVYKNLSMCQPTELYCYPPEKCCFDFWPWSFPHYTVHLPPLLLQLSVLALPLSSQPIIPNRFPKMLLNCVWFTGWQLCSLKIFTSALDPIHPISNRM